MKWHETARELKAQGLRNSEIARLVGKDRRTVSDLFHMPACPSCGEPKTCGGAVQCRACETANRAAERAERLERVAQMWDAGMTTREIADALGYGPNSAPGLLSELRKSGRIDYRYAAWRERAA